MKEFYTYMWFREDGTPYYVGKGTGRRAFDNYKHNVKCPPRNRVVVYPATSEVDALETEVALIWYYGRKDLGTGCLRNLTDGGEGCGTGYRHTKRAKLAIGIASAANKEAHTKMAVSKREYEELNKKR